MPTSHGSALSRTYIAFLHQGCWDEAVPLGTVIAPTRRAAWQMARHRWAAAREDALRVVTAASAPPDLVGRALALDGYAMLRP